MSTLPYCAKQAAAMAEFATDRAKAKLDDAIDREESRDELIACRMHELIEQREKALEPMDIVCGLHSIIEGGLVAPAIRKALLAGNLTEVGMYAKALIAQYIADDSETMAQDWIAKIDRECGDWSN